MNRKSYLLEDNAEERLKLIPKLEPPPSLSGPLRDLFVEQENERYKLRIKQLVEKEKLVLAVEQVSKYFMPSPLHIYGVFVIRTVWKPTAIERLKSIQVRISHTNFSLN